MAEHPDIPSAEYAPSPPPGGTALGRLVDTLHASRAMSLAIDAGQPDVVDQLAQARHDLAAARAVRTELDRSRWRPGRRDAHEQARRRESTAQERVAQLARAVAEWQHADRGFVDERSLAERAVRQRDQLIERQFGRGTARGREL